MGICRGGSGIKSIIEVPSGLAPRYQKLAGGPSIKFIKKIITMTTRETIMALLTESRFGLFSRAIDA